MAHDLKGVKKIKAFKKIEPLALYLVLAMLGDSAPSLHLSS